MAGLRRLRRARRAHEACIAEECAGEYEIEQVIGERVAERRPAVVFDRRPRGPWLDPEDHEEPDQPRAERWLTCPSPV